MPCYRKIPASLPDTRAYAKLEQLQPTGSFKLRGATNKIMGLSPEAAAAGVVTSSTGNHGLGVAAAAKYRGIDAEVFLSSQVPEAKWKKIESYGARIRMVGDNPLDAEIAARAAAEESGRTYVSPYNDWQVVAGQGTIAVELARQIENIDAVFIATGGGGLISGVGTLICKRVSPHTEIVGCWPENSRVLYECLRAGKIREFPETYTLSESTAGGVEPGSITFDLARSAMHRGVLVSEDAILDAMKWATRTELDDRRLRWRRAGCILSGGGEIRGQDRGRAVLRRQPVTRGAELECCDIQRVISTEIQGKDSICFKRAIVRKPGDNFADGLTTADLGKPDAAIGAAVSTKPTARRSRVAASN